MLMFSLQIQAYVSTEATRLTSQSADIVKIPYRIFVGGIAFNVSISLFMKTSQILSCRCAEMRTAILLNFQMKL